MQTLVTGVLSLIALGWIIQGLRAYAGMRRVPRLTEVTPASGQNLPRISVLFAARNEAPKLRPALESMLALDYPAYELIAVDDRSEDATPQILDEFGRRHTHLKVIHVRELPPGWLGKPHALETAWRQSSGDWLVFTDADVRFAPDALRRAFALATQRSWDHLTLIVAVDMHGFWEKVAIGYFGFCFLFGVQPWRVSDPHAGSYMGTGAFQLLRRSTYEAIGTHRRLAMEVVDDMKLGKLVKQGGFRSGIAAGKALVQVRWQEGLRNVVRGVTKNMFAGFGFRIGQTVGSVALLLVISILPIVALVFSSGMARVAAGISVACAVLIHGWLMRENHASPLYGLTHPLGTILFSYMILRSMVVTLWRGGVVWRGTFYPLEELKRGSV